MPNSAIATADAVTSRPCRIRPPAQDAGPLRRPAVFAIAEDLRDVGQEQRDRKRQRDRAAADRQQALFPDQYRRRRIPGGP